MTAPTVSIIMPIYNVERYLSDSISDVLNQTFCDFELLLINDASPDNSIDICNTFAKQDKRVKIINLPENKGVWNARNVGTDAALGEYILFLDSDDRISPDLLKRCVESAQENPCDVVVFGLTEEYFDKSGKPCKTKSISLEEAVLEGAEEVRRAVVSLEEKGVYGYPWNKLFRSQIVKKSGARFPDMRFNEDIIFNIDVFKAVSSCNILNITPYRYAKRQGSTTGKFIPTYYEDIMIKIDRLYEQFSEWQLGDGAKRLVAERYVRYFFSALERNFDSRAALSSKQRKEFIKNEFCLERYKNLSSFMGGGGLSGAMARAFKNKNVWLCLLIARIIYIVKRTFPQIFQSIS